MRVLFVTKAGPGAASSRTRVYNLLPHLETRSITVDTVQYQPLATPSLDMMSELPGHLIRAANQLPRILFAAPRVDFVYVQRVLSPRLIKFLAHVSEHVIFDIDDAIHLSEHSPDQYHSGYRDSVINCLQAASSVVVSSHELESFASEHSEQVLVIPSSVNAEVFAPPKRDSSVERSKPIVGWIGNAPDHIPNLSLLAEELVNSGVLKEATLRIIGTQNDDRVHSLFAEAESVELVEWVDPENVPYEVQKFDIGLSPLVDNQFNRSKCPVKTLEYMASGLPVLASNVGMHKEFITDGRNGYLIDSSREWVERINQLITNPDLRTEIGNEARRTVEDQYSSQVVASRLHSHLSELSPNIHG